MFLTQSLTTQIMSSKQAKAKNVIIIIEFNIIYSSSVVVDWWLKHHLTFASDQ